MPETTESLAQIDWSKPIELEDGTPCELVSPVEQESSVYVYANGQALYYHWRDGTCLGLPHFPKVRNVVTPPQAVGPRFEVRSGLNGTDRDTWSAVATFDAGADAGAWVGANKQRYSDLGKSLCIVKVEAEDIPAIDWRKREAERLSDGTYTPLPDDWADKINAIFPEHFAHVSQSDKRKVAFTESDAAGERDRQKVLSASAYVERYLTRNWSRDECSDFVSAMCGDSINILMTPMGDADAMERVYVETQDTGAAGCMSYDAGDFRSSMHPVRVYALGGDLTLAFLRSEADDPDNVSLDATWDDEGRVLARCIIWPQGKGYGRVYGLSHHARMLRTGLEAIGYSYSSLSGARIAKIEEGCGSVILPYLDIGYGYFTDCGDYLRVGGELRGDSTSGLCDCVELSVCAHCGEHVRETHSVAVGEDEHEEWCEGCIDYRSFTCHHSGELVSDSYQEEYYPSGGTRWSESVASWHLEDTGAAACEDTGEWHVDHFVCDGCGGTFTYGAESADWPGCCDNCGEVRTELQEDGENVLETMNDADREDLEAAGQERLPFAA